MFVFMSVDYVLHVKSFRITNEHNDCVRVNEYICLIDMLILSGTCDIIDQQQKCVLDYRVPTGHLIKGMRNIM